VRPGSPGARSRGSGRLLRVGCFSRLGHIHPKQLGGWLSGPYTLLRVRYFFGCAWAWGADSLLGGMMFFRRMYVTRLP
jgi:hypothetical protein